MMTTSNKQPNGRPVGFGFRKHRGQLRPVTRMTAIKMTNLYLPISTVASMDGSSLLSDGICGASARCCALVAVIYGSFETAAQSNSQLPSYIVYSATCLGLVALPLRHFTRTFVMVSLIWIAASAIPIVYQVAGGHVHVVMIAAIFVGGTVIFALYAIAGAKNERLPSRSIRSQESNLSHGRHCVDCGRGQRRN